MSWQNAFKTTPSAETNEFKTIPQGNYTAIIQEASINETKDPARVEWEFTIVEGEYSNRKLWQTQMLDHRGIPWIKKNLDLLDEACENPDKLESALAACVGKKVELYVKHNPNPNNPDKPYTNAYINELLSTSPEGKPPVTNYAEEIRF